MPSDEMIISMAGLGAFMATYAGIGITADAVQKVANVVDKAGHGVVNWLNRRPLEQFLDKLGIGVIPNSTTDPHTSLKNYNWFIERQTKLGTQEIGAMGLGLIAAAAIMWEMKHPYIANDLRVARDTAVSISEQNMKLLKTTLEGVSPILKTLGPEGQAKFIEATMSGLPGLVPMLK